MQSLRIAGNPDGVALCDWQGILFCLMEILHLSNLGFDHAVSRLKPEGAGRIGKKECPADSCRLW